MITYGIYLKDTGGKKRCHVKVIQRPIKLFFQDEARFGRTDNVCSCWVPFKQRAKVGNSIVWVIAGWEKEHTLWIANTIRITGALPDMDYIESTVGVNILVFDIGYIPKLLELDVVSPIAISLDIFTKIIERLSPNIRKLILAHKPHIINTFNAKWYLLYQDKVQATAGYRYVSLGLGAAIVTAIIVAIVAVSATIMVWRWSEAEIWRHKAEITRVQEEYEFRKYLVNTMKENPELAPYISDYLEMWEKYRYEIEKKRVKEEGMLERFEKIMWMGAFMMMALIGGILVIKLIEVIGK